MQSKKYIFFIPFILIALFLSCENKEWKNPFDANSDPKSWAPGNLQIEQLAVTIVKLTWEQEEDNISGFKIDRKIGKESWQIEYAILDTNLTEWIDSSAVPVSINYYRIYSFANENKSSVIEKSINPSFPTPTDLQINQLSDLEVKLIWKDNSTGEDGFKIDKKVGSGSWILGLGIVGSNIEEWIDTEPVLNEINYWGYALDYCNPFLPTTYSGL